ncbi:hypothetical protein [Mycobacterium noviomagense]|uniref:hypothetical protein n=1 Tax=Mycobacterium noviomagense TaxID=459858 RepID=UPI00111C01A1|nr:hypothetical protein [Mycobacterium noviomagense]
MADRRQCDLRARLGQIHASSVEILLDVVDGDREDFSARGGTVEEVEKADMPKTLLALGVRHISSSSIASMSRISAG